ncbi:hypothetical protein ACF0H5_018559 [Mactra antiquata]
MGTFHKNIFKLNACAWCYYYLMLQRASLFPTNGPYLVVASNASSLPLGYKVLADYKNNTSVQTICSTLDASECDSWIACCRSASACCDKQIDLDISSSNKSCSTTWDGYACWDGSTPGTNNYLSCPSFLPYSIPTRFAVKTCTNDGTWYKIDGREWTDYTSCLTIQDMKVTIFISLACQIASLIFLVPSLIIFFAYKFLRQQHRIRLHINFFTSFIFSNTFCIIWNMLVTYDRITNTHVSETLLHKNLGVCKLLSFLKLYFSSTNYAWMFCEGFYLYRLISNAFSPPKRLILFYLAGWGIPFTYCGIYAIIRLVHANESCWANSFGDVEWVIYAPNLTCLVVNIFFLCSILKILLTQLQAHPNEPSNFRRALKATFVLIPLFGVQLAVTIYRPPPDSAVTVHYERFSDIVSNSQGMVVALIFCIFNGEVATQMKRTWRRHYVDKLSTSRRFNATISLHFNNSVTQRTTEHSHTSRRNSLEPCIQDSHSPSASTIHTQQSHAL